METDTIGRLTDLDLEKTIIGQIVVYRGWDTYASLGAKPEFFFRPEHQKIIEAARAISKSGAEPDAPLLRQHGCDVMVLAASSEFGVPVREPNAKAMLHRLAELARARTVYYESTKLDGLLANAAASGEVVPAIQKYLETIENAASEDLKGEAVADAATQHAVWRKYAERRHTGKRVWLGVPALDEVLDGLSPGEVLGVMARPGLGKTTLLGRYIRAVADFGVRALFFSLEMPMAQIVTRLVQPERTLTRGEALEAARQGEVTEEDYVKVFGGVSICDRPGLSVAEMRRIATQVHRRNPLGLILIDHLGLVGGHRKLSIYERISHHAQEIKEMAKALDVPVVLALQVSRQEGGDGSQQLSLAAARDAGVIEETVDYLIGMRRPERSRTISDSDRLEWKDVVMIQVIKNRHGNVGNEVAIRIDETLTWHEMDTDELPDASMSSIARTRRR